jgi:hypothetical protein
MREDNKSHPGEGLINRRADRTPFSMRTAIHLKDANGELTRVVVLIEDYSPVGVGMTCDVFLERGAQFTMRMSPSTGNANDLLYSVAYCRPVADGRFRVGAEFVCIAGQRPLPVSTPKSEAEISLDRIRAAILG